MSSYEFSANGSGSRAITEEFGSVQFKEMCSSRDIKGIVPKEPLLNERPKKENVKNI